MMLESPMSVTVIILGYSPWKVVDLLVGKEKFQKMRFNNVHVAP